MPTLFGLSNTSTHLVWLWRYQWYRKYMTDKCSMTFSSIMVTLSTYCWWMKWNLSLALPAMSFVCCLQYESKLWVTAHTQISLLPWQTVLELQHWSSETEVDHKVGFSSLYVCTCAWVRHRESVHVCVCVFIFLCLIQSVDYLAWIFERVHTSFLQFPHTGTCIPPRRLPHVQPGEPRRCTACNNYTCMHSTTAEPQWKTKLMRDHPSFSILGLTTFSENLWLSPHIFHMNGP